MVNQNSGAARLFCGVAVAFGENSAVRLWTTLEYGLIFASYLNECSEPLVPRLDGKHSSLPLTAR
jgi:hypothetical protein